MKKWLIIIVALLALGAGCAKRIAWDAAIWAKAVSPSSATEVSDVQYIVNQGVGIQPYVAGESP